MKTIVKGITLIFISTVLILASCSDGEVAAISISLGIPPSLDKAATGAAAAASIDQLSHTITLSGPTGERVFTLAGAATVKTAVVAGHWEISAKGYIGEELYSEGYSSVEVRAGRNTNVSVPMTVVWNDSSSPPTGGGGGSTIDISLGFTGGIVPAKGFDDSLPPALGLSYELFLINNANPALPKKITIDPVTGKASEQVSPGNYSIDVNAYVNGWDYATGAYGPFDVTPGETKDIKIVMNRLTTAIALSVKKGEAYTYQHSFDGLPPILPDIIVYNFDGNSSASVVVSLASGLDFIPPSPFTISGIDGSYSFSISTPVSATGQYTDTLTISVGSFTASIGVVLDIYGGPVGLGSPGNPYQVQSGLEMSFVGRGAANPTAYQSWDLNSYYKLTSDLTLTGNWTPIGGNGAANRFSGTLDGDGYVISNLTITSGGLNGNGLFGAIGVGGRVENLGLENINISSGQSQTGGISGYNYGTIENCYVTGSVSGVSTVGGLVGLNGNTSGTEPGTIRNCYNTADVTGLDYVAGIAGSNNSLVEYCYNTGTVEVTGTMSSGGGIVSGPGGSSGVAQFCVSLGAQRRAQTGIIVGRISGAVINPGNNNKARADMLFVSTNGGGSSTVSPGDNDLHTQRNGESVAADNTVLLTTVFSGGDWSNSSIWTIPPGNLQVGGALPTLVTTPQSPAPTLP